MDYLLFEIIRSIGLALGAGASTVMLAQWIAANHDQKITTDEERLLSISRLVTRVAFMVSLLSHSAILALSTNSGYLALSMRDQFILTFLAIIFIATVFHTYGITTFRYSLAVQLTAWYAMIVFIELTNVFVIDTTAFIYAYLMFSIFAVFLLDRAYKYSGLTHTEAKNVKKTNKK